MTHPQRGAPDPHHKFSPFYVEALWDFQPEAEGELGLKAGDFVFVTDQQDEWFLGNKSVGWQQGWFPVTYVKKAE